MTDLVSLVVTVRTGEPVTIPGHLGRAVHAQVLRWVSDADPALAQQWHDSDGPKPFTCSSLVGGRRISTNARSLAPDRDYWFRVTSLEPALSRILAGLAADPPDSVELDGLPLALQQATIDPDQHPWAGSASYEQIAGPYLLAGERAPRRVSLEFVSPVTFRQSDMNMPIPMPDLVFGSLCDRWNAFSTIALSPEVRRYAAACVALNSFKLRSRAVPTKGGALQIGAVGVMRYVAVRYDRYWMGVLGLLADFAFYSGVGRMTAHGMGQSRRADRR